MRDGWTSKELSEICIKFGAGPFGSNMKVSTFVEDGIPVISGNHMSRLELTEESFNYITEDHANRMQSSIVQRSDVVITKAGTIGQVSLIPENSKYSKYVLSSRQLFVRPSINVVIPKYLAISLKYGNGQEQILSNVNRTGVPSLSQAVSFIKRVKVDLPPLSVQKRIVDLISSFDSYIQALQQQLDSAKKSRNAVLHELLTAGGDDWLKTSLGDVADVIDPHPSHRAPAVDDDGIPFIGIGDLRNSGDIDFAKARRVSKKILEEHKARYDRSDFLIGLGRVASIGMVVRLPDERTDYVVSPTLAVIKAKDMLGQFLFHLLEGPQSQEQFQRFKKGSTRESVGMQILRKIEVHIPPLPEQKRIVEIISSIDKVVDKTQLAINEAKNLRSGLLSDLLSGNHQIPASYDKVIGAA